MKIVRMQEAIENWFLDRLVPWFMYVAQYVGVLAFYYGIARILEAFFELKWIVFLIPIASIGFLIYRKSEKRRFKSAIDALMASELKNIKRLESERLPGNRERISIDIISRIKENLINDGFTDSEQGNLWNFIQKNVWEKCKTMQKHDKKPFTYEVEEERMFMPPFPKHIPTYDATLEHDDDFEENLALKTLTELSKERKKPQKL